METMKETQWEYTTAASSSVDQLPGTLNWLGQYGWEVVGITPHPTTPDFMRCLLKRPKIPDRPEDPTPWLARQAESMHHVPRPEEPEWHHPAWKTWREKYERDHGEQPNYHGGHD